MKETKIPLVIYHRADFDGLFCREIARLRLVQLLGVEPELLGWDHADPEPGAVDPERDLYILDLSIPSLMAHPRLVWIDHHKTAIDRYPASIRGLRIDGVAACRLAWQYFFGNALHPLEAYVNHEVAEPLAVQLAGEFDVWDKRDKRAETFQHGLRGQPLDDLWPELLAPGMVGGAIVRDLLQTGAAIEYASKERAASLVRERSFTVDFEGRRFLALNTARCNSLTFTAALQPEHEGCLAFCWVGDKWRVSLYGVPSKPELDFSEIAKKYGGGGHRQACGFETASLPFVQPQALTAA